MYVSWITQPLLLMFSLQGLLLVGILNGAQPSSTFNNDQTTSRTKVYLLFILAFTSITNVIVSTSDFCLD